VSSFCTHIESGGTRPPLFATGAVADDHGNGGGSSRGQRRPRGSNRPAKPRKRRGRKMWREKCSEWRKDIGEAIAVDIDEAEAVVASLGVPRCWFRGAGRKSGGTIFFSAADQAKTAF